MGFPEQKDANVIKVDFASRDNVDFAAYQQSILDMASRLGRLEGIIEGKKRINYVLISFTTAIAGAVAAGIFTQWSNVNTERSLEKSPPTQEQPLVQQNSPEPLITISSIPDGIVGSRDDVFVLFPGNTTEEFLSLNRGNYKEVRLSDSSTVVNLRLHPVTTYGIEEELLAQLHKTDNRVFKIGVLGGWYMIVFFPQEDVRINGYAYHKYLSI